MSLMFICRILDLVENFLSSVKWLEHNVTYVAKNIEMDLRYITWIDHDRGASFVPIVSHRHHHHRRHYQHQHHHHHHHHHNFTLYLLIYNDVVHVVHKQYIQSFTKYLKKL